MTYEVRYEVDYGTAGEPAWDTVEWVDTDLEGLEPEQYLAELDQNIVTEELFPGRRARITVVGGGVALASVEYLLPGLTGR